MIYIYIYRDLKVELSVRSLVIRDLSSCFVLCCARSQVWEAVKSGRLSGLWSGRLNFQDPGRRSSLAFATKNQWIGKDIRQCVGCRASYFHQKSLNLQGRSPDFIVSNTSLTLACRQKTLNLQGRPAIVGISGIILSPKIIELATTFVELEPFGDQLVTKNNGISKDIRQCVGCRTSYFHKKLLYLPRFQDFKCHHWYQLVVKNHWLSKGVHQISVSHISSLTSACHQQIIELARAFRNFRHLGHHAVIRNHWIRKDIRGTGAAWTSASSNWQSRPPLTCATNLNIWKLCTCMFSSTAPGKLFSIIVIAAMYDWSSNWGFGTTWCTIFSKWVWECSNRACLLFRRPTALMIIGWRASGGKNANWNNNLNWHPHKSPLKSFGVLFAPGPPLDLLRGRYMKKDIL